MSNDWFFEKFALIADAPGAVERMRELVLHMAVQGRLVPQLTTDDPAELLVVAIASDRAAFVKGSGLSRQRELHEVNEDLVPFALPRGWVWTRLGNICRVQAGFAFKSAAFVQSDKGIPLIRIRDITQDHTQVNYLGDYREEFLVNTGDYLIGMDGNFTVAKWRGRRALLNQRVSRLQWYSNRLESTFFAIAAQHQLTELQGKKAYTTVDHLSSKQIEEAVVPLPPLAEQKRIVGKVDELLGLCDALEAQQQERELRKSVLVRASLSRFAESPTPENLGYLFHKSYDIPPSELRKSILTLAVQGKLVQQDPNDEPAEVDHEAVVRTRENSTLKLTKIDSEATAEDPVMPDTWMSVCLGDLVSIRTGFAFKSGDYTEHGTFILRVTNINSDGSFDTSNSVYLPDNKLDHKMRGYLLEEHELLVVMVGGSLGKIGIVTAQILPALLNQNMWRLKPYSDRLDFRFLKLVLYDLNENRLQITKSTHGHLAMGTYAAAKVPFPPLAEQHRIVAKVDQLMALVDELERQQAASREKASNLLDAIVHEMTGVG
jgi:type I restriction enzyme S subunit